MNTVFISYSHVDSSTAEEITSVLSKLSIDYFRDAKNINWGDSITSKVRDALDTCLAILVIVSPASLKSHWVPYEIGHASAMRKIILPFLTHPSLDIPHYISDLNYVTTIEQVHDYFSNKFSKEVENLQSIHDSESTSSEAFSKVQQKMFELLAEMKQDLTQDESGLVREFFILPKKSIPVNSFKPRFTYYEEEHDHLMNKIDLLEQYGFVADVTIQNTPIYRMTEEFVELLMAM